mmetsp:Transcript_16412/g.27799  ORF Transcript_16412/g.27799 Transcript_16412/m.27799 type:complete len:259 (+) Transcript_16412:34-810(+)
MGAGEGLEQPPVDPIAYLLLLGQLQGQDPVELVCAEDLVEVFPGDFEESTQFLPQAPRVLCVGLVKGVHLGQTSRLHAAQVREYEVEVGHQQDQDGDDHGCREQRRHCELVAIGESQLLLSVGDAVGNLEGEDAHGEGGVAAAHHCRYEELEEELVGEEGDAVAHPGTVVIHLEHTPPADRAVVGPRRLYLLAFSAESVANVLLEVKDFSPGPKEPLYLPFKVQLPLQDGSHKLAVEFVLALPVTPDEMLLVLIILSL